jgi:hypothetical protein
MDEQARMRLALLIWDEARSIAGSIVEDYLISRGLDPAAVAGPEVLRFHPRLRFDGQRVPGLVALMRHVESDEPRAVHRTFLDPAGRKVTRRMLGPAKHAAIKLDPAPGPTSRLAIGEGIETCETARLAGFRPAWALASAGAIRDFPVLAGVEAIGLLEEADETGRAATAACAERWARAGREAWIIRAIGGGDLNDLVRRDRP